MTIAAALTGCASVIDAYMADVTVYDHIPPKIVPPIIGMTWGPIAYGQDFDDDPGYTIMVTVMVPRVDLEDAQDKLLPFTEKSGAQSIFAAIETDPTLDGTVHSARVVSCGQAEAETVGTTDVLTCTFTVEVYGQ